MHGDLVADLAAHERLSDRTLVGQKLIVQIHFIAPHYTVFHLLVQLGIVDLDRTPDCDDTFGSFLVIYYFGVLQLILYFDDLAFDKALFVLGFLVFGVLGQVPEFTRDLDLFSNFTACCRFKVFKALLVQMAIPQL